MIDRYIHIHIGRRSGLEKEPLDPGRRRNSEKCSSEGKRVLVRTDAAEVMG